MTRYLCEMTIVPEAVASVIKEPQNRAETVRHLYESVGGELEEYYFAVGQDKIFTIGYIPDEVALEAMTMAVVAGGAISSMRTIALMTAAEAVEAMKKVGEIQYKPPSAWADHVRGRAADRPPVYRGV